MFLSKIIEQKRREVEAKKLSLPLKELKAKLSYNFARRSLAGHINKPHTISLIAEIKQASPSRGIIRQDFDLLEIAAIYQEQGVAAISVLTDKKFFKGNLEYIRQVREITKLPVLRKDFIIDEYQVYESAYYEADALLLIADILSGEELTNFMEISRALGMEALVEIHTEEDLEKTLKTNAAIIGINNRNLTTFEVDLETTSRLIPLIPKDKIKVSESGIKTHDQILFLKSLGVNAVLIGEAFMESQDIRAQIQALMHSL